MQNSDLNLVCGTTHKLNNPERRAAEPPLAYPPRCDGSTTLCLAHTPDGVGAILVCWQHDDGDHVRLAVSSFYFSDRTRVVSAHQQSVPLSIAMHMGSDGSVRDGLIAAAHKLILAAAGRDNTQRDVTASLADLLKPVPEDSAQRGLFALAVRARPLFDALRQCAADLPFRQRVDSAAWWHEELEQTPATTDSESSETDLPDAKRQV